MFHDEVRKCRDCGSDFTLSVSEQEFFEAHGYESKPVRCKRCREIHQGIRDKKNKGT